MKENNTSVFDNYACDGQMNIWEFLCKDEKHVKRITYEETKPFILGIHYARRMPVIQYAFGLYVGGYLSESLPMVNLQVRHYAKG